MGSMNRIRPRSKVKTAATLAAALLLVAVWVPAVAAAAPTPSAGSATVDGNPSDWDLGADFFAEMAKSGIAGEEVLGRLYLRYDCDSETLFGLVMAAGDWQAQQTRPENAYLSIDGAGKLVSGESGTFAWVGGDGTLADGYEASGELAPGSYTIRAHVLIDDPSEPDTEDGYIPTETVPRNTPLVIECGEEEPVEEEPTPPVTVPTPTGNELPTGGGVRGVTATPPSTDAGNPVGAAEAMLVVPLAALFGLSLAGFVWATGTRARTRTARQRVRSRS